jgi:uncharacterized metal-binding protein
MSSVLRAIDGVCVLGFLGVAIWVWAPWGKRTRWAAFPALWLSGTMLLYQNLNALYFFDPIVPGWINIHTVFWVLMILMMAYLSCATPGPPVVELTDEKAPWARWVGGAAFGSRW